MQSKSTQAGFTLIETLLVLAMVGILVAIAVPNFSRYQTREQAKTEVTRVAGFLREARARAIKEGIGHIVVFIPDDASYSSPPGNTDVPQNIVARMIRDTDGDWRETTGELAINLTSDIVFNEPAPIANGNGTGVTRYGRGVATPMSTSSLVRTDDKFTNGGATLTSVTFAQNAGASFYRDPTITGLPGSQFPAVAFTPRGVAVRTTATASIGSGAGSFYITDNQNAVYAASVSPLGEVRVTALSMNQWR